MAREGQSLIAALALILALAPASRAEGPVPTLADLLTGNTVSAVLFVPHEAPKGGGSLNRIMFQAFLQPGGTALIRRWDPAHDAYTPTARRRWSVSGANLCLDFPDMGESPLCIEIHAWGPRIAGNTTGTGRFAMLDGDIAPGNTLVAAN